MGTLLTAQCVCGFQSGTLALGGGMLNFQNHCGAPALCTSCGRFQVLNYLDETAMCEACRGEVRFYDHPSLRGPMPTEGRSSDPVFSWNLDDGRKFLLPGGLYVCPKCRQKTLRFESQGNWD